MAAYLPENQPSAAEVTWGMSARANVRQVLLVDCTTTAADADADAPTHASRVLSHLRASTDKVARAVEGAPSASVRTPSTELCCLDLEAEQRNSGGHSLVGCMPEGSLGACFQLQIRTVRQQDLLLSASHSNALLRERDGALLVVDASRGHSAAVGLTQTAQMVASQGLELALLFDRFDEVLRQALDYAHASVMQRREQPAAHTSRPSAAVDPELYLALDRCVRSLNLALHAASSSSSSSATSTLASSPSTSSTLPRRDTPNTNTTTTAAAASGVPMVDPRADQVLFGSSAEGWGFSLRSFARLYASRAAAGVDERRLLDRLWGEHYYDAERKRWRTHQSPAPEHDVAATAPQRLLRGFEHSVLLPILQLGRACRRATAQRDGTAADPTALQRALHRLGVQLPEAARLACATAQSLFALCMRTWLPLRPALASLCVRALPSPLLAHAHTWYRGEQHDETWAAIRACDPTGPLCVAVTDTLLSDSSTRTLRHGHGHGPDQSSPPSAARAVLLRVLSGTLRVGDRVRVLEAEAQEPIRQTPLHQASSSTLSSTKSATTTSSSSSSSSSPSAHDDGKASARITTSSGSSIAYDDGQASARTAARGGSTSTPEDTARLLLVHHLCVQLSGTLLYLDEVPAGSTCLLELLRDQPCPPAASALCTARDAHGLRPVCTLSASSQPQPSRPLVSAPLEPAAARDLPLLTRLIPTLCRQQPGLHFERSTGEHILSASTHHELAAAYRLLQGQCPLQPFRPVVALRETVSASSAIVMTKAPNRHNRFYFRVSPIDAERAQRLFGAAGEPPHTLSAAQRGLLTEQVERELVDALSPPSRSSSRPRLWSLAPNGSVLVRSTCGVQYVDEVKDSSICAFEYAMAEGPLIEAPVMGVRVDLVDLQLYSDAIHRGAGQVIPPVRRGCLGGILSAAPRLLEPFYTLEVLTSEHTLGELFRFLLTCRGMVEAAQAPEDGYATCTVLLPVRESFSLESRLPPTSMLLSVRFSHWGEVPGDPLQEGTVAYDLVTEYRRYRGLSARPRAVTELTDTL